MRTVFITGAEGFTGRHLTTHLKKQGFEVVGGVRNRARKLAFEKQFGKSIVCDVSDAINVARAVASVRPDAVVHLAGATVPYFASEEPLDAYQSIVTGWANVCDAVRRSVPRARILLASSAEVYGNAGANRQPLPESTKVQPTTTFGWLKSTAENVAQTFFRNYHLDLVVARPFHYTGAGQTEAFFFGSVAKRLIAWDASIRNGFELPDLAFERDLLHVQDVVEAYAALLKQGKPNEIYNICGGQTYSVRQVCEWIAKAAGRSLNFGELPSNTDGQIPWLGGDNTKLASETGWKPTRTVEQAAGELVESLKTSVAPTIVPVDPAA